MPLPSDGSTTLTEPRVLIISRVPDLRRYMAEALLFDDCAVQVAIDAEQGLTWLQRATEGWLVLLQLDPYPDMWELMRLLHKTPQLHAYHRLIQFDVAEYVDLALLLEPDDVLQMPFSALQLFEVVHRNWEILRHAKPPWIN